MHKRLTEKQRGMWSFLVLALALPTLPMSLSLLALTAYIRFVVDEELELVQGMNTAGVPFFLAVTGTLNFLSNLLLVSAMARAHRPSVREPSLQALFIAVGLDVGATLLVFIACIVCFVQNELLGASRAVEAAARSNLGHSGLRTTSRQSLERLCFSRRGVFLRKRCLLPEIRLRPFILVPFSYGVLNHCPLSGYAVDQS
ncbi:hypothetical protein ACOMHN_038133 [Nucella lapillus]